MARMTIGQKGARVLKFLMGLRHPKVARALMKYGFSQADLDEGWAYLRKVTRIRLAKEVVARDPRTIALLDKFENEWFVICGAVLLNRFPAVHAALFLNLKQASGNDVAVTVMTFLTRLREMEAGKGEFGEAGPLAREELRKRGLTDEIVVEVETLAQSLSTWEPEEDASETDQEREESEEQMWAWYKEWSAIAQVAITDRRLLRSMGYLTVKRSSEKGDAEEEPRRLTQVVVTRENSSPGAIPALVARTESETADEPEDEEGTAAE